MLIANTQIAATFAADDPDNAHITIAVNGKDLAWSQLREISPQAALRLGSQMNSLAETAARIVELAEMAPGQHLPEPAGA